MVFCRVCSERVRKQGELCANCEQARAIIQRAAATMMFLYGIPRATGVCMDCQKRPAEHRDHRRYSLPLTVDYVCGPCNKRRGPAEDLDYLIRAHRGIAQPAPKIELAAQPEQQEGLKAVDLDGQIERLETAILRQALADNNGNRTKAAEQLGISFRTMRYRMMKIGI